MEDVDFFVSMNVFASNEEYYPCEIGISQIHGTQETDLITVDLSGLDFTFKDREDNFELYKTYHGIVPPDSIRSPKFYKIKYEHLDHLLNVLFNKGREKKTFAVQGREHYWILLNLLTRLEDCGHKVVEIGLDFQFRKRNVPTSLEAPCFHHNFHRRGLENQCAGKIAWTFADFIRDKVICSNTTYNVMMIDPPPPQQQQQQQQENDDDDDVREWTTEDDEKNIKPTTFDDDGWDCCDVL